MSRSLARVVVVLVLALGLLTSCAADFPRIMRAARGGMPGHHVGRVLCPAPDNLPGRRVDVVLMDGGPMMGALMAPMMGWTLRAWPARVRAGTVSFVATSRGRRTHELVVLPLAPHRSAGSRHVVGGRVSERGSLGEASASCASGEGEGIRPGRVGWVTLRLAPGRYELVCNLRHHYAAGMHQLFVVRH